MKKRRVYLGLTFLIIFLISFIIGSINTGVDSTIGSILLRILAFSMFSLLYVLLSMVGSIIAHEFFGRDLNILPLFIGNGIVTIFYKRIYFMDLGYFWCHIDKKGKEVTVYDQKYLILEKKFSVRYNDDINQLKDDIKDKLEKTFSKISEKRLLDKKIKSFKMWDGSVDKSSYREKRLKRLLK